MICDKKNKMVEKTSTFYTNEFEKKKKKKANTSYSRKIIPNV